MCSSTVQKNFMALKLKTANLMEGCILWECCNQSKLIADKNTVHPSGCGLKRGVAGHRQWTSYWKIVSCDNAPANQNLSSTRTQCILLGVVGEGVARYNQPSYWKVVSCENAPANRNSSSTRTQYILWGVACEYGAGRGAMVRKMNSLPAGRGKFGTELWVLEYLTLLGTASMSASTSGSMWADCEKKRNTIQNTSCHISYNNS